MEKIELLSVYNTSSHYWRERIGGIGKTQSKIEDSVSEFEYNTK